MQEDYFISARDVLSYKPILDHQALLELIKSNYPNAPIKGTLILYVDIDIEIKCIADIVNNGFIYRFTKVNNETTTK
ncbi:MAG: hypothetical protein ACRCXT_17160 [Paraclostridium sp.]